MDYPRNPPARREILTERRPGPDNVYTPGFTIEGGRSGLTEAEYESAILNHDPLVEKCLNKFRWHLISGVALAGIGGRFWAKHRNFRLPATIIATATSSIFAAIVGVTVLPSLTCHPEEINSLNRAVDLATYGPWKRDSGEDQIFRPTEMEMDDAKWEAKGLVPPSQRPKSSL